MSVAGILGALTRRKLVSETQVFIPSKDVAQSFLEYPSCPVSDRPTTSAEQTGREEKIEAGFLRGGSVS
jgi:hypothetical protein